MSRTRPRRFRAFVLTLRGAQIVTLDPATMLVTNAWSLKGDEPDLRSIALAAVSGDSPREQEFTLDLRKEPGGRAFKGIRFSCACRPEFLAALMAALSASLSAPLLKQVAPGAEPRTFSAHTLVDGVWGPTVLRVQASGVQELEPASGAVLWEARYTQMREPALEVLRGSAQGMPGGVAVFARDGSPCRLFAGDATREVVQAVENAAEKFLGLTLPVDASCSRTADDLVEWVRLQDKEQSEEAFVCEWEVTSLGATDDSPSFARRLILTTGSLVERNLGTFEICRKWPLSKVTGVVRPVREPRHLGLQLGQLPGPFFSTPQRDEIVAALVDCAEMSQGQVIPCLPCKFGPGEAILAYTKAPGAGEPEDWERELDEEVARAVLGALYASTKEAAAVVGYIAQMGAHELQTDGSPPPEFEELMGEKAAAVLSPRHENDGKRTLRKVSANSSPQEAAGEDAEGARARYARAMLRKGIGPCSKISQQVRRCLRELNASTLYGCPPGSPHPLVIIATKDQLSLVATAILALLPPIPSPQPAPQPPPPDSEEQVLHTIALQCLARLSRCHPQTWRADQMTGLFGRLMAALSCGADAPAAEAARLMSHLFGGGGVDAGLAAWAPKRSSLATAMRNLVLKGDRSGGEKSVITVEAAKASKNIALCPGSSGLNFLLEPLRSSESPAGPLLAQAAVEAISAVLCIPGSATTDSATFAEAAQCTSDLGRPLFALFNHPSPRVRVSAARIMQCVADSTENGSVLRAAALREGALLQHLSESVSQKESSNKVLSRSLVELWSDEYGPAMDLLRRIFPPGLFHFLRLPGPTQRGRSSSVRRTGISPKWEKFWEALEGDHNSALLIWDAHTRSVLRETLEREEGSLNRARTRIAESGGKLGWNHAEFEVTYPTLERELTFGGVHIRHLFAGGQAADGAQDSLREMPDPCRFFNSLQREFLYVADRHLGQSRYGRDDCFDSTLISKEIEEKRMLCLQAMAAVYCIHGDKIGPIEGLGHFVKLMDSTPNTALRHKVLLLLEAAICPLSSSTLSPSTPLEKSFSAAGRSLSVQERAAWGVAEKENCRAFVLAGGVPICISFVAGCHSSKEKPVPARLQGNLLTEAAHEEEAKMWYVQNQGTEVDEEAKAFGLDGPFNKAELKHHFGKGKFGLGSLCWTDGMEMPALLGSVREIRWDLGSSRDGQTLSSIEAARHALHILLVASSLQRACDADGRAIEPLPLVHRQLCSKESLPHLAQAFLCQDPHIVSGVATLLRIVLEYNGEALPTFFRTGAFFFAMMYTGNNFLEVARLLQVAHLKQAFHSADEVATGQRLAGRSFLGGLLPEALLYVLEQGGYEAFASTFVQDSVNPEVVWTNKMRSDRLVAQLRAHVGDLPRKLQQHSKFVYEYTPIPPIGYPELDTEVWCHRYYLRNLCDIEKFPGWPIQDRVELLQQALQMWRAELVREPGGITFEYAYEAMQLQKHGVGSGEMPTEAQMKKAYRHLARLYHPDKNPEGREKFIEVQRAFEWLSEKLRNSAEEENGDGPRPWRLLLFVRAQCILFARCARALAPFKYAGYPLLLEEIQRSLASTGPGLRPTAPQLESQVQLCWLTCVSSPLNGEELHRCGGLPVLASILRLGMTNLSQDVSPNDPAAAAVAYTLRTLAGLSALESVQDAFISSGRLIADILRGCLYRNAPAITEASLRGCINLADSHPAVQRHLYKAGALWKFIPLLFEYNPTLGMVEPPSGSQEKTMPQGGQEMGGSDRSLESSGPDVSSASEGSSTISGGAVSNQYEGYDAESAAENQKEEAGLLLRGGLMQTDTAQARNLHASFAARALATLGGYFGDGSGHKVCRAALRALLTPPLAARLANYDPRELLYDLNRALELPHVIWNGSIQKELGEICLEHLERADASAGAAEAEDYGRDFEYITNSEAEEAAFWDRFVYETLRHEFVIGTVFIRVFNQRPVEKVEDPAQFAQELLAYIEGCHVADSIANVPSEEDVARILDPYSRLSATLQALNNLLSTRLETCRIFSDASSTRPVVQCLEPLGSQLEHDLRASERRVPLLLTALNILQTLSSRAAVVEVLSEEFCLSRCFWLLHESCHATVLPSLDAGKEDGLVEDAPAPLQVLAPVAPGVLSFLTALSKTGACAWAAGCQAGALYLLSALLPDVEPPGEADGGGTGVTPVPASVWRGLSAEERGLCANLVGQLMAQTSHGGRVTLLCGMLLPQALVDALRDGPGDQAAASVRDYNADTPERVWTAAMARRTAESVRNLAGLAMKQQRTGRMDLVLKPEAVRLSHPELADEVVVGGVFLQRYLKEPSFALRSPRRFLDALIDQILNGSEVAMQHAAKSGNGSIVKDLADKILLRCSAAAALLRVQPLLADHADSVGAPVKLCVFMAKWCPRVTALAAADSRVVLANILRIVHQLVGTQSVAESLSAAKMESPGGPTSPKGMALVAAVKAVFADSWGQATRVLVLEALKRVLSPTNRGRGHVVLLAYQEGFVTMLLAMVDWKVAAPTKKAEDSTSKALVTAATTGTDTAAMRVLAVDVLRLLAHGAELSPPNQFSAAAAKVKEELDASDVWRSQSSQRHDLYLPGAVDNSRGGGGVAGLLHGAGGAAGGPLALADQAHGAPPPPSGAS